MLGCTDSLGSTVSRWVIDLSESEQLLGKTGDSFYIISYNSIRRRWTKLRSFVES